MIELLSLIGILDCLHISFHWAFFNILFVTVVYFLVRWFPIKVCDSFFFSARCLICFETLMEVIVTFDQLLSPWRRERIIRDLIFSEKFADNPR